MNQSRSRNSSNRSQGRGSRDTSQDARFQEEERKTQIIERQTGLSKAHETWLRDVRGIDPEVAAELGCYSATVEFGESQRQAHAFVTPCVIEDRETSWQARFDLRDRPMKGFVSGENARHNLFFATQIWEQDYTICDFRDMCPLKDESPERVVVVHEGQLDAIAGRCAGFVSCSMPNGTKSLDWIDAWAEKLANCRRVVFWLDNDEPGTEAADSVQAAIQTIREKLWGNIYFVNSVDKKGERIKDAGDALKLGGVELVRAIVLGARTKSAGKFNITPSKLHHPVTQFKTGLDWLDSRLVLCAGEHTAIIGRTNRGKSKFANYLAYQAARFNNQRVYFQSFETVADGELTADLAEIEMGLPIEGIMADPDLQAQALDRIRARVVAAEPALVPKTADPFGACLGRIVEQASEGVRIHVIDNYSMVQTISKMKNENQQTKEDIIALNEVCRKYDIAALMVYHARKGDPRFSTKNLPPEVEDASGSGAIGNHCCLAVSVERVIKNDVDSTVSNVAVRKARRRVHGKRCNFSAYWDLPTSCFDWLKEGFDGIEVAREKRSKGSDMGSAQPRDPEEGESLL